MGQVGLRFGLLLVLASLLLITGCVGTSPPTLSPMATVQITLSPMPVATQMPHTFTPNLPTSIPSPIASSMPELPPPRPGWAWYQSQYADYRIAYPQSWTQQKDWGPNAQSGAIQERVRFYSLDSGPEVIVDVWDVAVLEGSDLLAWINSNPEGLLFARLAQPVSYNATILGLSAVFQYQPAASGTGDLAVLIFSDEKHVFRIFLNGTVIPPRDADASVYRVMLESFAFPGGSGTLSVPIPVATLAPELSPTPKPNLAPAGEHSIYENEVFGYHLTVPAEATITEGGVESFPHDELPTGMTFEAYLAQLRLKYPGKLCVTVRYQLWSLSISAPPNQYGRYALCGTTGIGDYEVITRTESITVEGRSYTATGWEVRGPDETLAHHYEFFRVTLADGTEIEYGSWPAEAATYADYLKTKSDLLQTVTSYAKID